MTRRVRCMALVLAAFAVSAGSLAAQGSNVMQHGACATALVSAGVASPCRDGSAILFNPAALARQESGISAGVTGIRTQATFTYDFTGEQIEQDATTAPVPFGYLNYRINDRLAAGFGVFAPYGLGIEWPLDFEGRYVTYDTSLRNIFLQPTLAYEVTPWLSVGAGVDVVLGSIELNQRIDLAEQIVPDPATGQPVLIPGTDTPARFANLGIPRGTDFADARLSGDGTGVTFNVGAIIRFNESLSAGVRYLHAVSVDYDGDADFTPVPTGLTLGAGNPFGVPGGTPVDALLQGQFSGDGALANRGIATTLELPRQVVVGLAISPMERLKLLADYQFTGWESFDVAVIEFEEGGQDTELVLDYRDTHTFLFGGEYAATPALDLRAGFRYNTAAERAASVSPFLPEADRNYYSVGVGYAMGRALRVDLGYQLIAQADRRGRVRGRTLDQRAGDVNVGLYGSDAHAFSLSLIYGFGSR